MVILGHQTSLEQPIQNLNSQVIAGLSPCNVSVTEDFGILEGD